MSSCRRFFFMSTAIGIVAAVPRAAGAQTTLPSITIATPKKPKAPPKPLRRAAVKPPASTSPAPRFGPRPDTQLAKSAAGAGSRTQGVQAPAGATGAEGGTGFAGGEGGPISPAARGSQGRRSPGRAVARTHLHPGRRQRHDDRQGPGRHASARQQHRVRPRGPAAARRVAGLFGQRRFSHPQRARQRPVPHQRHPVAGWRFRVQPGSEFELHPHDLADRRRAAGRVRPPHRRPPRHHHAQRRRRARHDRDRLRRQPRHDHPDAGDRRCRGRLGLFLHRPLPQQQHRHRKRHADARPDPRPQPAGPLLRLCRDAARRQQPLRVHVRRQCRALPDPELDRHPAGLHRLRHVGLRLEPAQREPERAFDLQHPGGADHDRAARQPDVLLPTVFDAALHPRPGRRPRLQRRGLGRHAHEPRQRHPERQRLSHQRSADVAFRLHLPGRARPGDQRRHGAAARRRRQSRSTHPSASSMRSGAPASSAASTCRTSIA